MYTLVYKRILENAGKNPDKAALIRPGEEKLSYGQLKRHIAGAGHYLLKSGVRSGDYVILAAPNSISFVYAYLAIHSLGAVAVPLDPQTTSMRLKYIIDILSPKAGFWLSGGHGLTDIAVFDKLENDFIEDTAIDADCVGVLNPIFGEVVAAFVVSDGGERYALNKMRELLTGVLENHQMPCFLTYISEIPKTASGKIQRSQLRGLLEV